MRIHRLSLVALSITFAACGGGDEGGGTTPDPDTGAVDTGTSGDSTVVDTGTEPTDTGTEPTDTGTAPTDTGTAPTDTGTAPTDTGTAPTDTGTAPTDTGTAPTDTGTAMDTSVADTAPTDTGTVMDTSVADTAPADTGTVTDTGTADTGGCTGDSACTDGRICVTGVCRYAATCKELHTLRPALTDGIHKIDFGASPAFSAYCDMTTLGGGWTRIAHIQAGDREITSVYRAERFFHKPWRQEPTSFSVYTSNSSLTLDGATPGMLDARSQFKAGNELRFSCNDLTRSLKGDAYHMLNALEATEWLDTLTYTPAGNTWKVSRNSGSFLDSVVYPSAAPANFWGSWHICGAGLVPPQGPRGFQLGVCATGPGTADNGITNANQIAIGYHDGFAGIRLECTADTPGDSAISNGYLMTWVR